MAECKRHTNKDHVPHHQAQMSGYPKKEVPSRDGGEGVGGYEENIINVCGIQTLLGNRGAHILLHYDSRTGTALFRLGIWKLEGIAVRSTERGRCLLCAG